MRNPRVSHNFMGGLGWSRVDPRPWTKLGARWEHRDGWVLQHCGHPTANWPWALYDATGRMHCTGSAGGRPEFGRAWPSLKAAVEFVVLACARSAGKAVGS